MAKALGDVHVTGCVAWYAGISPANIFENSKNNWDLEYVEKKSLTNEDSFLLNIKKIKKKYKDN